MAATNVQAFSGDVEISSNLAVDTNTLFVDSVGGTVGIGTTLIDITDNTLSGAGNGLYIHNPVEGGHLLTLGTQRPWVFEQGLADASAELNLRSLNNGKKFSIQSPDHSNVMTIVATNGGGAVGIGSTIPIGVNGGRCLEGSSSTGFEYIATRDDTTGEIDDFVGAYLFKNADTDGADPHYAGMSAKISGTNGPMNLHFHSNRDQYEADALPAMIIISNGNVGIGTTNPDAKLTIGSTASLLFADNRAASTARNWAIRVNNTNEGDFQIGHTGSNSGGLPDFYTDPGDAKVTINKDGRVGIATTSPAAMLDVNGTARLSNIQRTAYMEELSKTFYFVSGGSGTNNAVLLEINVNSSAVNDQREFAGTIDLHIVAQRTSSSHNVDCFNGQLHFVVGWNEQIDSWQVREFNQETKASHTGSYRVLESRPVFRYKYVNRRLQIYVQYAYNTIGARHSYVARVTADRGASSDVSIVSETSLMATGTDIQAGIGLCYDQGGNAGLGTNAPGSFRLNVNGSLKCIGAVDTSSDDRIKYNEEDIPNALTLVSQLKPQKYEKIMEIPQNTQGKWIPTDAEWESVKDEYKHGDEFGFIAQDVRAVPELSFLVHGEETQTDTKTLTPEEYSNLTTEEKNTYTVSYTYVSTEDPISAEEYSKLTTEEQSGYYQISDESVYKKWDIDAITYSNLIPKVQQTYTQTVGGYTKQIENQTPLSLNYNGLFVVAIGAIKELKAKNDALEARITALENA